MTMWQATYTSQICGSLFVLPMGSAYRADEKREHSSVRWHR